MKPRNAIQPNWKTFPILAFLLYAIYWVIPQFRPNFLAEEWWYIDIGRQQGPLGAAHAFAIAGHPNFRLGFDWLFWQMDILFQGNPLWFALANVAVVTGSAVLLWSLFRRIFFLSGQSYEQATWYGYWVGVIFLTNSAHVEAVNWVSCLNVTLGLFFGLWGLNVLADYCHYNYPPYKNLVGSSLLFLVALSFRETAIFWPVIGLTMVAVLSKGWRLILPMSLATLLVDGGYLFARHQYMGKAGTDWLSKLHGAPFKHDLTVSLNSALLPLGRQIAYLASENWMTLITVGFLVGTAGILAFRSGLPGKFRADKNEKFISSVLVVGFGFQIWQYADSISDLFTTWICWALGLMTCTALWFAVMANKKWRSAIAISSLILLAINFAGGGLTTRIYLVPLAIGTALVLGERRPANATSTRQLVWIGLACLVAVFFLSILGAGIGQQYWGENQRESYEASAFGAVVVVTCLALLANQSTRLFYGLVTSTAMVFGGLLALHNYVWSTTDHYALENGLERDLQQIIARAVESDQPKRVFILCAPQTIWNEKSESIGRVLDRERGNVDVRVAFLLYGSLPTDRILIHQVGTDRFSTELVPTKPEPSRYIRPSSLDMRINKDYDRSWFAEGMQPDNIQLVGYQPGDVVAVVNGDHLVEAIAK